jgi:hypothetical protein
VWSLQGSGHHTPADYKGINLDKESGKGKGGWFHNRMKFSFVFFKSGFASEISGTPRTRKRLDFGVLRGVSNQSIAASKALSALVALQWIVYMIKNSLAGECFCQGSSANITAQGRFL